MHGRFTFTPRVAMLFKITDRSSSVECDLDNENLSATGCSIAPVAIANNIHQKPILSPIV